MRRMSLLIAVVSAASPFAAAQKDWNSWRGPDGTGYAADGAPPIRWSETENVAWKVALPGKGYASPVVSRGRIYLLSAQTPELQRPQGQGRGRGPGGPPAGDYAFHALALDQATGAVLWDTVVSREPAHEGIHPTSSYASASAVVGEDMVYASFGSRGIYALTLDGEVVWSKDLGDMSIVAQFGEASTPALSGDTLVVPWDHQGESFIVGLDARTGGEKWRQARNERTNWTSPAIAVVGGRAQAIMPGQNACIAYDVATGEEIWRAPGLTPNCIPVPIIRDNTCYLMAGYQGAKLLAIDLNGAAGDLSASDRIKWTFTRGTPYVPTGVLSGDNLFFLSGYRGQITSVNVRTGAENYLQQRLDSVENVYASIVGANGHLYVCDRDGEVAVIKDGPQLEIVAFNTLEEPINATPAIVGKTIFIRTDSSLYRIEE